MDKCLPYYRSCWNVCPASRVQRSRWASVCPSWVSSWLFHLFYESVPFPARVTTPEAVTCTSDVPCVFSTTSPCSAGEGPLCRTAWGAQTSRWGHIDKLTGWVFWWHTVNTDLSYFPVEGLSVVSSFTSGKKTCLVNGRAKQGSSLSTLTCPTCQGTITRCHMAAEVEV